MVIDVDLREATRIKTDAADSYKVTLKTRPRSRELPMQRAVIYDHRDERDKCDSGSLARVQISEVSHEGPIKRTFVHHRYRGARDEFTRSYRFSLEQEQAKGLTYLGQVEVEKEFPGSFLYIDLLPPADILPVGRLVVTTDDVALHHQNASGEPVLTSEGQPVYTPIPRTDGAVLPAWERVWANPILALYSTDLYGVVKGLYTEKADSVEWFCAAIAAFENIVLAMAKAGTLPPNAEKRWDKIQKLRAQAAGTSYEAEALTALRQAVAAFERLTGCEDEEVNND
ncbi:MAG: DUF2786 domain-containing protein [Acidobacteriota bacterium]